MPATRKKGGMHMEETTPNRNRSRQVKFWVSDEEYELLQKKMKAAGGVNQGAYIRKMILDGYIINLDIPELQDAAQAHNQAWQDPLIQHEER